MAISAPTASILSFKIINRGVRLMSHQIICIQVSELNKSSLYMHHRLTTPSLCLIEYSDDLMAQIERARQVLSSNELEEVVLKVTGINWLFELTKRYGHNTVSYLHVTPYTIAFSGLVPPNKEPYFTTPYIATTDILIDGCTLKKVELDKGRYTLALSMVKELEVKEVELEELSNLIWRLDEVGNSIHALDNSCINSLSAGCDSTLLSINEEINHLEARLEKLELYIEQLLRRLVKRLFGIDYGDWLTHISAETGNKVSLRFEHCSYHNKVITFSGVGITKAGKVGKRDQSISIDIRKEG